MIFNKHVIARGALPDLPPTLTCP